MNCGNDKESNYIPDEKQVILHLRKEEEVLVTAICSVQQLLLQYYTFVKTRKL